MAAEHDKANKKAKLEDFPYVCEIEVAFPTARHALEAMQVMQVDAEIGDKVCKSFSLQSPSDGDDSEEKNILRILYRAAEAKILRVAVSSFYDYLTVALKVYQEFDPTVDSSATADSE